MLCQNRYKHKFRNQTVYVERLYLCMCRNYILPMAEQLSSNRKSVGQLMDETAQSERGIFIFPKSTCTNIVKQKVDLPNKEQDK